MKCDRKEKNKTWIEEKAPEEKSTGGEKYEREEKGTRSKALFNNLQHKKKLLLAKYNTSLYRRRPLSTLLITEVVKTR